MGTSDQESEMRGRRRRARARPALSRKRTAMKSIAVINQKGGVGKTTTAATLATIWARGGKRVLAVDMDPQGNLGLMLGEMYDPERPTVYNVLSRAPEVERVDAEGATVSTRDGVDLIPSSILLDALQREDAGGMEFRLRIALDAVEGRYDVCVIDCPPTCGLLARLALMAADEVVIPTNAELCSVAGFGPLFETVGMMSGKYLNPGLKVAGIVVTRFDKRNKAEKAMLEQIGATAESLGVKVFESVINSSEAINTARNRMTTVVSGDAEPGWRSALCAKAYEALAEEIYEGMVA